MVAREHNCTTTCSKPRWKALCFQVCPRNIYLDWIKKFAAQMTRSCLYESYFFISSCSINKLLQNQEYNSSCGRSQQNISFFLFCLCIQRNKIVYIYVVRHIHTKLICVKSCMDDFKRYNARRAMMLMKSHEKFTTAPHELAWLLATDMRCGV